MKKISVSNCPLTIKSINFNRLPPKSKQIQRTICEAVPDKERLAA
jgi:hypothetical protein